MIKVLMQGAIEGEFKVNTTQTGKKVTNITIAEETRGYTTRHKVVFWEKHAEVVENLPVGAQLFIECDRIQYRSYEGKDGVTRWVTELVASKVEALSDNAGEIDDSPIDNEPIPGF